MVKKPGFRVMNVFCNKYTYVCLSLSFLASLSRMVDEHLSLQLTPMLVFSQSVSKGTGSLLTGTNSS